MYIHDLSIYAMHHHILFERIYTRFITAITSLESTSIDSGDKGKLQFYWVGQKVHSGFSVSC